MKRVYFVCNRPGSADRKIQIISFVIARRKDKKWIKFAVIDSRNVGSYVSGIYDCEFDPLFVLSPGYNEGYYLDLSIRGAWSITDKIDTLHLGTGGSI